MRMQNKERKTNTKNPLKQRWKLKADGSETMWSKSEKLPAGHYTTCVYVHTRAHHYKRQKKKNTISGQNVHHPLISSLPALVAMTGGVAFSLLDCVMAPPSDRGRID